MKRTLTLAVLVVIGHSGVSAQRAVTPADATVFIRLVGSMRADVEEVGAPRQTAELTRVEIGTGSGFVISPHGYVLTNEHVVSNTQFVVTDGLRKATFTLKVERIAACFPAGVSGGSGPSRCFDASVHSSDAVLDLAVLFIGAADLPYVAFGDSDILRAGQVVNALGYPFGRQLEVGRIAAPDLVPEISTSAGTISALRAGDAGEPRAIQINGTVNPGNSGGPLVDQDGYAVGVIRARVTGDSGIGFAIPINRAKDFLESRGLDSLMPARRLRLGASQSFEGKGIALRLPDGVSDGSPFRTRVESDPGSSEVALRIDRSVSPWTTRQIEQALTGSEAFERLAIDARESQTAPRPGGTPLLLGRANGTAAGSNGQVKMHYGILELGPEKLVARYVGPAEQVAYNEGVLRDSLMSLEGRRLIAGDLGPVASIEWSRSPAASGLSGLPFPIGWIIEPGSPSACPRLPDAKGAGSVYPANDVTLALRVAVWDTLDVDPEKAAAGCSSRRGTAGAASYVSRVEWLGVSYSIEGIFLRLGGRRIGQLEVISPDAASASARALLAAWVKVAGE
jgi:S1-C subfamily serine protease